MDEPGDSTAAFEASKWRTAFEAALACILADYEGQETKHRAGMESGMRKLFEHPYTLELGLLSVGSKAPLGLEEAQRVIFFPRPSDMRRYVAAFARETSAAGARREALMKFKLLAVFYALHRKDSTLVDRFMHCGGLESLAVIVAEDNRVIQSQAVELLMEFLSPLINMPAATEMRQAHLMHQVFACVTSPHFWSNLAKIISVRHEVFPRSHAHVVRILAGAVGWLRPENPNAVPQVAPPRSAQEAAEALKLLLREPGSNGALGPDVKGLAEDLLEELLAVPRIRQDPQSEEELAQAKASIFAPKAEFCEDAAHAWQALRSLGNTAFQKGLLWPAEAAYRLALEEGAAVVPADMASMIHSNRALVLLNAGHPEEAAAAAEKALLQNSKNVKAAFRRAQALLEVEAKLPSEALLQRRAHLKNAVAAAELAMRLDVAKDKKVAEAFERAKQQLAEMGEEEETAPPTEATSLDDMD